MAKEMNKMKEKMKAEKTTMAQQILSLLIKQTTQINQNMNIDALGLLTEGVNSLQCTSNA